MTDQDRAVGNDSPVLGKWEAACIKNMKMEK